MGDEFEAVLEDGAASAAKDACSEEGKDTTVKKSKE